MAEAPGVTFIIPTLNRRHLILECLASIAAQSEGGWRVVVVDDASSDGTEEAVRALAMPELSYLRNDVPLGAADSRNRGVAEADSEVVAFIDSDDRLHENYLARLRDVLRQHPEAGVVCCDSRVVDAEGRVLHGGVSFQTMEARRKRYRLATGFRSFEDIFVFSTTLPGTAARRDAFLAAGGFPQWAFPMEDVVFQLHAAARGLSVYYLHEVLADYRVHEGSASAGTGRAVITCAKKAESLAACAPLAPPGTRRRALRRRQADVQVELAIALWWAGMPARAILETLRSLVLDPTVLPRVLLDRLQRPQHVEAGSS